MTINECRSMFLRYRSQGLSDVEAAAMVDQARADERADCPWQARLDYLHDLRNDLVTARLPTANVDAQIAEVKSKLAANAIR